MTFRKLLSSLLVAAALVVPSLVADHSLAHAQTERESPLADQPPVRHRILLVRNRFEITPAFEATVNPEFRQALSFGGKLEYHISDMFSVGVVGFYGINRDTELTSRIINTLPDGNTAPPPAGDPTPTKQEFSSHLNEMPFHGAAYIGLTPWYGKLAAFGQFFVNFDFYFQAGVSFAQLKASCADTVCSDRNPGVSDPAEGLAPDNDPNNDPTLNDGNRYGLYLGGGIHVFLNDFIALDLTVRDLRVLGQSLGLGLQRRPRRHRRRQPLLESSLHGRGHLSTAAVRGQAHPVASGPARGSRRQPKSATPHRPRGSCGVVRYRAGWLRYGLVVCGVSRQTTSKATIA